MTPFGPVTNPTQTSEWRQAGGNPMIYEQIMTQKMMAAQQKAQNQQYQAMLKQQKAFQKWTKEQAAKKAKGQPVDPAYQQMLDNEAQAKAAAEARAARAAAKKEKKRTPARKAASPDSETTKAKAE